MRRVFIAAAGVALTVCMAGCGGSGGPAANETSGSPSVTPTTALPAHTGLVGAIDSARRVAVCENVRVYATTVDGGLSDAADQAFDALVQTLREPPHEPGLMALARRWETWRAHLGDAATAGRLTAFCSG